MTDKKRREFVKQSRYLAVLLPSAALLSENHSYAQDADLVDEKSAQAVALKYVAVSEVEGKNCNNCALYQGDADSEAGPCALFPGKKVAGPGWCSAWVVKS